MKLCQFYVIIRIKGSSCYTLAQIFPEFLACEQALYLGDIVKRRRAGDTREERAGRLRRSRVTRIARPIRRACSRATEYHS